MSQRTQLWRAEIAGGVGWFAAAAVVGSLTLRSALPPDQSAFLWRQLVWYALAAGFLLLLPRVDYRIVAHNAVWLVVAVVAALVAVELLGVAGGGSQRWLRLGPVRVQPSEFAKLAIILWTAQYAAARVRVDGMGFQDLAPAVLVVGFCSLPVLMQPDLGTAVVIVLEALFVIAVAGIARRVWISLLGAGSIGVVLAWFFLMQPYQKRRIFGFLNPEADPLGIGYHTLQSKIAVGAGGVWGAGWGEGTQAALRFLPEQHTDFIFSVWAEEWGFVGALVVLLIYAGLLRWIVRAAFEAKDLLGRLLAAGIFGHFLLHAGINLAMVVGLAPVVGVPLPLLSYGGSAMLLNGLLLGIVGSIRVRRHVF